MTHQLALALDGQLSPATSRKVDEIVDLMSTVTFAF
jgi:hypothetical protein